VLTASGPALRKPIKSIHWAGTESATEWIGYMNGIVMADVLLSRNIIDIYKRIA